MPFARKKASTETTLEVKFSSRQQRRRKEKQEDGEWHPTRMTGLKTKSQRRSSSRLSSGKSQGDVELRMECVEEELSPAQLKALQQARDEHEKANDLIKLARAGNILVPSSQPNTFTVVPPKQSIASPGLEQGVVGKHLELSRALQPTEKTPSLPPPRPEQFTNKMKPPTNTIPSPEVIIIDEHPPRRPQAPPTNSAVRVSLAQNTVSPPTKLKTVSLSPNATPQQVYKFVSLPNSQTPSISSGQWVIKPLLTVSPQQQMGVSPPTGFARPVQLVNCSPSPAPPAKPQAPKPDTATGSKRPSSDTSPGPAVKKKSKKNKTGETDSDGNWIPLDEYYYGVLEGDPLYVEEKGEYRFKCWYCSKMLYNNVRAMQHIQGHIDTTKQQNIDLSDLTQCKHCYKQFDTPFEMQTHVEKVHLSNRVLMCRICEKDFASQADLIPHMRQNHVASEMPYTCQLCNFRSSMYSDVVNHFKKRHDSSNHLLCLYCLRTFNVRFNSQGWGLTQTYYGHLMKHQSKSTAKKCTSCRLTFFNSNDLKIHRTSNHGSVMSGVHGLSGDKLGASSPVMMKVPSSSGAAHKRGQKLKSLNAPAVSKIQDYGGVQLPGATQTALCIECKMTMASTDHYKKHINCSLCRFATSCSVAYANHMMGFHSGQMSSLNLNIPWERRLPDSLYCNCGFATRYGNKIANHLVVCQKQTCYSRKPDTITGQHSKKGDEKRAAGSLLGVLGLVQKRSITTKIKTSLGAAKARKVEEEQKQAETKNVKHITLKAPQKPNSKQTGRKSEDTSEVKPESVVLAIDDKTDMKKGSDNSKGHEVVEMKSEEIISKVKEDELKVDDRKSEDLDKSELTKKVDKTEEELKNAVTVNDKLDTESKDRVRDVQVKIQSEEKGKIDNSNDNIEKNGKQDNVDAGDKKDTQEDGQKDEDDQKIEKMEVNEEVRISDDGEKQETEKCGAGEGANVNEKREEATVEIPKSEASTELKKDEVTKMETETENQEKEEFSEEMKAI